MLYGVVNQVLFIMPNFATSIGIAHRLVFLYQRIYNNDWISIYHEFVQFSQTIYQQKNH